MTATPRGKEGEEMSTKKTDERQFDLRIVERRLAKGQLDPKEFESYLKNLPDEEPNADYIEVYEEPPAEELTPHIDELTFTSA
jgi:hypothetical protein